MNPTNRPLYSVYENGFLTGNMTRSCAIDLFKSTPLDRSVLAVRRTSNRSKPWVVFDPRVNEDFAHREARDAIRGLRMLPS